MGLEAWRFPAAALVAALLGGCAGPRAVETGPRPAAVAAPPTLAAAPVAPRWDRPFDDATAAALFDAGCLAFAPQFPSAAAFEAAGFRGAATGAPRLPGDVFLAARPDQAWARLGASRDGEGQETRRCALSLVQGELSTKAIADRIDRALRARFPGHRLRRGAQTWRVTEKESQFDMTVAVGARGGRVLISAAALQ